MRCAGFPHRLRAARLLVAALAISLPLAAGTLARAERASPAGADALRAENQALGAKERAALLELYALESRLASSGRRLEGLQARLAELQRRERVARNQLELARRSQEAAQQALNDRVRALYVEGEPDPLTVIFGAASLDDVISAIDSVNRLAGQDERIIAELVGARRALRTAIAGLDTEERKVAALAGAAAQERERLAAARDEKAAFIASLRERRSLNERTLADLTRRAAAAEQKAEAIASSVPAADPTSGGGGDAAPGTTSTPVTDAAAGGGADESPAPGRQVTVSATMYCLTGTTATGIPVAPGVVATDPAYIPLGTRMSIPGYGEGVAADTGGAVKGWTIDMWVASCARADAYGRQTITITIND